MQRDESWPHGPSHIMTDDRTSYLCGEMQPDTHCVPVTWRAKRWCEVCRERAERQMEVRL